MRVIQVVFAVLLSVPCLGQDAADLRLSLRADEPVMVPQPERLQVIMVLSRQLAAESEAVKPATRTHYLVSEEWCIRCRPVKTRFLDNGWPRANILTIEQCRRRFGFVVPHVPYEFEEPIKSPKLSTACGCSAACTCGCQTGTECICGRGT